MAAETSSLDVETEKELATGGDGDCQMEEDVPKDQAMASASVAETSGRRKNKKINRQNSKEDVNTYVHRARSWKNSRRSRNGFGRGLPKKGGAGGKGVWGLPGSELLEAYEDVNDPNYDNENLSNGDIELKAVIPEMTMEELRKKVEPIILEYFENGDTNEAALYVEEIVPRESRHLMVQLAIEMAMDHKISHCEMTSVLISDLFGHVINEADISRAFESLLANVEDLILDIPEAPIWLGNFIARAIADDCIPPKFIKVTMERGTSESFLEALSRADTLLSMKHGLVRLHNIWGVGGALRAVKYLTRQISLLLQEYLSSGDIAEASRCLRALEVPHFHHELVYEAIVMALEANSAVKEEALCKLLKTFDTECLITPQQMEQGFLRVFEDLPDISMDVPLAYIILDRFVDRCYKQGFLTENVMKKLPPRGRKRFVSEGDQHFFKSHKVE